MKKFAKMLVLAAAMVMMVGAGDVAEAKGTVKKVQITKVGSTNVKKKSKLTVKRDDKNKKLQLTVKVSTKNGASKDVKFKSSNKKVVAVSQKGELTIKKAGTATITVTSKQNSKKKDTIKITVKQNVTKVNVSFTGKTKPVASYNGVYTLVKGKKYQLKSTVSPKKASEKKVSYKSSKKSVASVSKTGKITAKKAGTAKITVTAKDGSKKNAVITVYVTKKVAKSKKITSMSAKLDKDLLIEGDTANVVVTVNDNAALKKYAFKSDNTKVATVDATTGKLTAVSAGTATITVKAMDGSKKSTTLKVTVNRKTFVKPVEGKTADVTVSFSGSESQIAADITNLVKAAGIVTEGQTKQVTVNGKKATLKLVNGEIMVVGNTKEESLVQYITGKKAENDKVSVTYGTNTAKAVAALEVAKLVLPQKSTYTYDITIDGHKATSMEISAAGMKIVIDGKTYDADVKSGVIEIMGDVTGDAVITDLVAKGYVTVTTTAK